MSNETDPEGPRDGRPPRRQRHSTKTAVERPLPWLIASFVFVVNAVLSATRADWWLTALELATGALALASASAVANRRDDRTER